MSQYTMSNLTLTQRYPLRRAFITGAGSGLGQALAYALAAEGWHLGLSDIQGLSLTTTSEQVQALGGHAHTYTFDVADREAFGTASQHFLEAAGGIDLLINNAGVGDGSLFNEYPLENWEWMISINQMGVIHGCHYFLPTLIEQGRGHILNIASIAAFTNNPFMSAYCATKAAVRSLSEALMYEMTPKGIDVSVAMPPFFQSNVMSSARGPEQMRRFAHSMMQKSGLTAQEVANSILKGVEKRRFEIWISRQAWWIFQLKKFFPGLYRSRVQRLVQVFEQT